MLLNCFFFYCLDRQPHAVHFSGPPGGNDLANPQWSPELLADEYISYYGNAGRVVVFCGIVYRVRPRNVSSETFAEQADRFNRRLKERCSANSHLLFWNHGRLGPYTVRDGTHLTDDGNWKFYLSIRLATLTALSVLQMQEGTSLGLALFQPKKTLF